jgi:hypothetical protein
VFYRGRGRNATTDRVVAPARRRSPALRWAGCALYLERAPRLERGGAREVAMTDYWLSKLFFDLQSPPAAAEYRADRAKVLARYPLAPEVLKALAANDVAALAPLVNPYLLRFYFQCIGMPDAEFIAKMRALMPAAKEAAHG